MRNGFIKSRICVRKGGSHEKGEDVRNTRPPKKERKVCDNASGLSPCLESCILKTLAICGLFMNLNFYLCREWKFNLHVKQFNII